MNNNLQTKHYKLFLNISIALVVIGIGTSIFGFIFNPLRAWANVLICNYYFISLVIGASFFAALQSITQSGWSAMFKRITEAISGYLPFAFILMLIMFLLGAGSIYKWTHEDYMKTDELLLHKAPYMNYTFFIIRFILFFGCWIIITGILRKLSIKEDKYGGLEYFNKYELYSKIYIFVLALTFSLGTFDWIMSVDALWTTDIFAWKNFGSAFLHGSAAILLLVLILHKMGYFPDLSKLHLHDFSKYLFMLSIIWGYLWFSQYFLIWFANMPEETIYYSIRNNKEWVGIFHANIIINWLFPFLFLFLNRIARNINALIFTSIVLLIGLWIDIYDQVMPGVTGKNIFGFIELGVFLGFLGIFIFAVAWTLNRASLIPENHPYLKESVLHKNHD